MPPKKTTSTGTKAKAPAKKTVPAKKTTTTKSGASKSVDTPAPKKEEAKPRILEGVTINIKQLNNVLENDEDGKLKASGRWPLVIDEAGISARFFRHRDCNFLEVMDQSCMEAERIRLALLGGLRFGKPVILDMADLDLLESVVKFFDNVQPGLWKMVMDKSIMEEENFKTLIKESDDEQYSKLFNYTDDVKSRFGFYILTMKKEPEVRLLEQVYPVRIE